MSLTRRSLMKSVIAALASLGLPRLWTRSEGVGTGVCITKEVGASITQSIQQASGNYLRALDATGKVLCQGSWRATDAAHGCIEFEPMDVEFSEAIERIEFGNDGFQIGLVKGVDFGTLPGIRRITAEMIYVPEELM